jgi:hypothetical protein
MRWVLARRFAAARILPLFQLTSKGALTINPVALPL